jgi:hypothetical protein
MPDQIARFQIPPSRGALWPGVRLMPWRYSLVDGMHAKPLLRGRNSVFELVGVFAVGGYLDGQLSCDSYQLSGT